MAVDNNPRTPLRPPLRRLDRLQHRPHLRQLLRQRRRPGRLRSRSPPRPSTSRAPGRRSLRTATLRRMGALEPLSHRPDRHRNRQVHQRRLELRPGHQSDDREGQPGRHRRDLTCGNPALNGNIRYCLAPDRGRPGRRPARRSIPTTRTAPASGDVELLLPEIVHRRCQLGSRGPAQRRRPNDQFFPR